MALVELREDPIGAYRLEQTMVDGLFQKENQGQIWPPPTLNSFTRP